ncbi:hypothetical protein Chor_015194 [Crotalus horridus]
MKQACHTLLYVYNLPTNRDSKSVCLRLRRLSDNCGGKVLTISGSSAILRFLSQDSAERAQKRMENEDVFGNRITVSFTPKNRELAEAKNAGSSVADKAKSPKKVNRNAKLCLMSKTANDPSATTKAAASKGPQGHGSAPKNTTVKSLQMMAARSINSSPVDKKEKENAFQVSFPSAFSMLTASRQHSPILISQSCWSSSVSNRSSPLALNVTNSSSHADCPDPFANGADIQISNLDYRLSRKELQQSLQDTFSKHGKVKNVELSPHTDYQLKAVVQMENLQEAITAVNSLHRYKIEQSHNSAKKGFSDAQCCCFLTCSLFLQFRSNVHSSGRPSLLPPPFQIHRDLREKVSGKFCTQGCQFRPTPDLLFAVTLIRDLIPAIPGYLFGHKLNVSDLHKLTDIVAIRDQGNGRLLCLLPSSQARQSPLGSSQSHDGSSANCSPVIFEELEYHEPVCKRHCVNKDFSEHDFDPDSYKIPFVVHSLKAFAPQVHSLLQTHEGTVPLLSFQDCYASEFNSLEMVQEGQGGVPLEHLISCVPGVNIAIAQNGIKVVKWIHNKPPPPATEPWLLRSKSPVGNPQLIQFSREVIDLLKNQPSCIMSVNKFIPMYHHHFAKQCRVSDYGYSKLIELLESVPHVLQILGIGTKRLLTLTHRAQVKRFTQDLLKLLKSQASKRVIVKEFLHAYHWCFSKDWDVTEYGVCELVDLISEIPDTTISLLLQDNEMVICIPKRERTKEEMERTKQFCKEVVLECGEEKILMLTEAEQVKALAAQVVKLLRSQKDKCLMMADVLAEYAKTFGYPLRLQDYDVGSVPALVQKLCHVIKVVHVESGKQLQLINKKSLRTLTSHLLVLLMTLDEATVVSVQELKRRYEAAQGAVLNPCEYGFMTFIELLMSVPYFIEVFIDGNAEYVKLTDLYVFAKKVRMLLHTYHYQQIFLHEFSTAYSKYTGEELHPNTYGYNNLEELLGAIPSVVWIKGHGHKRIVVLKNDMKTRFNSPSLPLADESYENEVADSDGQSTKAAGVERSLELILEAPNIVSSQAEEELLCLTNASPVDLLCQPVPSCLPSPQLRPDPVVLESTDLIQITTDPEEKKAAGHSEVRKEIGHFSEASKATENILASPCFASEHPGCREATESPARKQPKSRVKLAANFSFAPVTKL